MIGKAKLLAIASILCAVALTGLFVPQLAAFAANFSAAPLDCSSQTELSTKSTWVIPTVTSIFTGTIGVAGTVRFVPTGLMNSGRWLHTMTLLPSGKVLVAGGYGASGDIASVEEYDPALESWRTVSPMASVRRLHTATLLADGRVLVVGGIRGGSTALSSVEIYDPFTNAWSKTGSLSEARGSHTATLLSNGKVLVAGGTGSGSIHLTSCELYDPASGNWSLTGRMGVRRTGHEAVTLSDGRVLVAGGGSGDRYTNTAEVYDPGTGVWNPTASMNAWRGYFATMLLPDGRVLAAGGTAETTAETYDSATGTWTLTSGMIDLHYHSTLNLLLTGEVLAIGGDEPNDIGTEMYHPDTRTWTRTGDLNRPRTAHTAVALLGGSILVAGGDPSHIGSAEVGTYLPANVFTATLRLPAGWTGRIAEIGLSAITEQAAVHAASLRNDNGDWGDWIPAVGGSFQAISWDLGLDGPVKLVSVRLQDSNGQIAEVVTGTVAVDTTPPTSSLAALPRISRSPISLSWSAHDNVSGVATYDLQVRAGTAGEWLDILTNTIATSTVYSGANGTTYYFRVRAKDNAGNVGSWHTPYDTFTLVDTESPVGTLSINSAALATTTRDVVLSLAGSDQLSQVVAMRLRSGDNSWADWTQYVPNVSYTVGPGDGEKVVYGQYRDEAGNISTVVADTIRLDENASTDRLVSINRGALWVNNTVVTLIIGAPAGTTEMQVSNDGGFSDALWQPFDTRPSWTISGYGSYAIPRMVYVRTRGTDGIASAPYSDDIIYDPVPPLGSVSIESVGLGAVKVRLTATDPDHLSGVEAMRVGLADSFGQTSWEPFAPSKAIQLVSIPAGGVIVLAQFRDGAGNLSELARATRVWVFLPSILR